MDNLEVMAMTLFRSHGVRVGTGLSHAGPRDVNRAAELQTLPGLGCSDLGRIVFDPLPLKTNAYSVGRINRHVNIGCVRKLCIDKDAVALCGLWLSIAFWYGLDESRWLVELGLTECSNYCVQSPKVLRQIEKPMPLCIGKRVE